MTNNTNFNNSCHVIKNFVLQLQHLTVLADENLTNVDVYNVFSLNPVNKESTCGIHVSRTLDTPIVLKVYTKFQIVAEF